MPNPSIAIDSPTVSTDDVTEAMSYPSLVIDSPSTTTSTEDVIQANIKSSSRPNPINTSFAVTSDDNGIPQVSPTQSENILHLLEQMDDSITFKCMKHENENTAPHPMKRHLQNEFKQQSLKQLLCENYGGGLKLVLDRYRLEDYPLCLRLMVFSLCATVSGLRQDYQIDQWDLVASAWCGDVSSEELRDVCFGAVHEFLFLSYSKKKKMTTAAKKRVLTFLNECKESMTWPRSSSGFFWEHLKRSFSNKNDNLFVDIFVDSEPPKAPGDWDTNTMVFLLGMLSLSAAGQHKPSPRKLVGEKVAGVSEASIRRKLTGANVMDKIIEEIEEKTLPKLIAEERQKAAEERQKAAIDLMTQSLGQDPTQRTDEMNQFLQNVANKVLQEKKGKNHICEVESKFGNGKKKKMVYAHLPEPQKPFSLLGRTSQNDKANILVEVVERLADSDRDDTFEQKELVSKYLGKFGNFTVLEEEEFKYTMPEVAVIRSKCSLTLNQMKKLDQCERALKGNTRFCSNFKKKFSEFEKEDNVPQDIFHVELEMNGGKGMKKVGFMESSCPYRLVERMLKTFKLAGAFVESEMFSSLLRAIFVSFGCDKDSDQTSMMMRIINREHGNCSHYVATLSMYEEAKECYENIKKSILRKDGPIQPFLQKLVDNKLFALCVSTTDVDGKLIGCEYVVLKLFSGSWDDNRAMLLPEMTVEVELGDHEYDLEDNFVNQLTCPGEYKLQVVGLKLGETEDVKNSDGNIIEKRFKPGDIDNWKTGKRLLKVVLVSELSDDTLDDLFYGYRLYEGHKNEAGEEVFETDPCFAGLLEKPVCRKFGGGIMQCEIQQMVGIHSADMKNVWNIKGMMDGANAAYSCIICNQPKNTYEKHYPSWLRKRLKAENPNDTDLLNKLDKMKDYCLRTGQYSNDKMHALYLENNGGCKHNYAFSKKKETETNWESLCVIHEELISIHPEKDTMGPLHLSSGLGNHKKDQTDKNLMAIDMMEVPGTVTCMQNFDIVKGICQEFLADTDGTFKNLVKENKKKQKEIETWRRIVIRGKNGQGNMNPETVKDAEGKLEELLNSPEFAEYRKLMRLRAGAKLVAEGVDPYKKSKKAKGQAQSIFRRAIQMLGGEFNAQHGGMELSNAACMRFLENFPEISAMVKDAYEFECEVKHKAVQEVMEKAEKLAASVYEVCKCLKSQEKWDAERKETFQKHAAYMICNWQDNFDQKVFPKLHCVVWHVLDFVERYGAFGIFSEEAFESRHQVHKQEASHLKHMMNDAQRLGTFCRRIQANINAKFQDTLLRLTSYLTGKPRGKYKVTAESKATLTVLQNETGDDHGVINISDDVAIKREWAEVYYLIIEGKVPASWNHPFVKRVNIDDTESIYTHNT